MLCFTFVALFGCEKEEPLIIPQLEIINATDITDNTATLRANILEKGSEEIVEYGFVWKADAEVDVNDPEAKKVMLTTALIEGTVSATLTELERGVTYHYQFYIRTTNAIYTSEQAVFTTQVPIINTLSPTEGIQGTEVTLSGKYFGTDLAQVEVFVEGEEAEVTAVSETQITFIVPQLTPRNAVVRVAVNEVYSENLLDFNYLHSFTFSPYEVRAGTSIVVTVSNGSQNNIYKIGGIEVEQSWTWMVDNGREIGLEVPANLPLGETTLEVFNAEGTRLVSVNEEPLTIIPSGSWTKKQNVDIGGYNTVGFVINDQGYLIAGDKVYTYDQNNDSWSAPAKINFLSNSFFKLDAFVIGEYAYILADASLYRFDPATLSLETLQSFSGAGNHYLVSFTDGSHIFTGLGYYYSETNEQIAAADFWKYQPSSDTWTQLADLPTSIHYSNPAPIATYIHGKGHIFGLEKHVMYNINTDNTTEINTPVNLYELDMVFTLKNKLYFGRDKFYEFDPSKNVVLEESTSSAVSSSPRFTLIFEDKAYIGVTEAGTSAIELWEFTPGW